MAFAAKFWNSPAPGELRATGGPPTPGRATNGTSRSPTAPSTASARTPAAGSWKGVMIEAAACGLTTLPIRFNNTYQKGNQVRHLGDEDGDKRRYNHSVAH